MFGRQYVKHMVLMAAGLLQLCGCSGAKMLDLIIPDNGYTLHKDIDYGRDARHRLDVYVPENPNASGSVVLFFYGGSWQKGSKDIYRFVGQALASRGVMVVVADYRLYPQIYYPAFMEDAASALAWVHHHSKDYGGNPDNLFVSGHSAGAYMAVMLALNESFIRKEGGGNTWIRGVIGLAGPYDFLPFTDPDIQSVFSQEDDLLTQPIHYVRKEAPPLLLLSGDDDREVYASNSQHLARAQRAKGGTVVTHIYPDVGHIGIILAMVAGFEHKAPTLEHMVSFIQTYEVPRD
jgi:acetyl esterase/lipase